MRDIVVADIGGTHARFAVARTDQRGTVALGRAVTLRTADHADLPAAWRAFAERFRRPLPKAAAIAVAAPLATDVIEFTNSPWMIRPAEIEALLGLDRLLLINDFVAVGHAVAALDRRHFRHLCGPDRAFGADEVISIIGPGTGLGVAHVLRRGGRNEIVASEGGHIAFAPLDEVEDAILRSLRERHGRVSVERIVSGPGLAAIDTVLAANDGDGSRPCDEAEVWSRALAGSDRSAVAALDRFCACLGSIAGDLVLAHGGTAAVIAGGLGLRLADRIGRSGFARRFADKGRFERMMAGTPVKLVTHEQPGLFGAAVAFADAESRRRN
jgi:glucokinase